MYTPEQSATKLRETFGMLPGDTVYAIVRHVSRSGMSRWIDLYHVDTRATVRGGISRDMQWIGGHAANVLGWRWSDKHRGILVSGAGFNAAWHVVSNLGSALYPRTGPHGSTVAPRLELNTFRLVSL